MLKDKRLEIRYHNACVYLLRNLFEGIYIILTIFTTSSESPKTVR
jgi:hypothetical protein